MKHHTYRYSLSIACALLINIFSPVIAETYTVKMISTDPNDSTIAMDFVPALLKINKGDTVIFEPTQKGHNTASKKGMIPDGAESWNSSLDKQVEVTFNTDGAYGYVCIPHYNMGMVGLILVGDYHVNLKQVRKVRHRGKAKSAFKELFKQIDPL